jgi:hypothetical protein
LADTLRRTLVVVVVITIVVVVVVVVIAYYDSLMVAWIGSRSTPLSVTRIRRLAFESVVVAVIHPSNEVRIDYRHPPTGWTIYYFLHCQPTSSTGPTKPLLSESDSPRAVGTTSRGIHVIKITHFDWMRDYRRITNRRNYRLQTPNPIRTPTQVDGSRIEKGKDPPRPNLVERGYGGMLTLAMTWNGLGYD